MSGNVKSNAFERVMAPILILLVTLASLVVLAFLGSKAASYANAFVDAYSIPNGFHLSDTNGPSSGAAGMNGADLAPALPAE